MFIHALVIFLATQDSSVLATPDWSVGTWRGGNGGSAQELVITEQRVCTFDGVSCKLQGETIVIDLPRNRFAWDAVWPGGRATFTVRAGSGDLRLIPVKGSEAAGLFSFYRAHGEADPPLPTKVDFDGWKLPLPARSRKNPDGFSTPWMMLGATKLRTSTAKATEVLDGLVRELGSRAKPPVKVRRGKLECITMEIDESRSTPAALRAGMTALIIGDHHGSIFMLVFSPEPDAAERAKLVKRLIDGASR